jgi:hypothetical protein
MVVQRHHRAAAPGLTTRANQAAAWAASTTGGGSLADTNLTLTLTASSILPTSSGGGASRDRSKPRSMMISAHRVRTRSSPLLRMSSVSVAIASGCAPGPSRRMLSSFARIPTDAALRASFRSLVLLLGLGAGVCGHAAGTAWDITCSPRHHPLYPKRKRTARRSRLVQAQDSGVRANANAILAKRQQVGGFSSF